MSEDEELKKLREKRMKEIKLQAERQQQYKEAQKEQEKAYKRQKEAILRQILSSDARLRLQNLRLAKSNFASAIENQLIQLYATGQLQRAFNLPLSDEEFKSILIKIQDQEKKRHQTRIRII
ncbi:MAG: DNA-binding protein [Promethearchaeota archaeon]